MKKVFFLSMMLLVACLASKAFAFDEGAWDLEERIYLGEFFLGKANLTSEMNHGILRLGGLPDGRFVRVSVRTNRAGDVDLNTQLVEKREQTVVGALRRIIPVSKLPEANVEVVTGRYDQDGVDAQGAWIEVYKPHIVELSRTSNAAVTNQPVKTDESIIERYVFKISLIVVIIGCAVLSIVYFLLNIQKFGVQYKARESRIEMLSIDKTSQCGPPDVAVKATFDFGYIKVFAWAHSDENGRMFAFHDGGNGRYFAKNNRKWEKSVYTTLQNWLNGKDVDGDNQPHNINYLLEAIEKGQVTRVA